MLDYLGEKEASDRIINSIEKTLSDKKAGQKTYRYNNKECSNAVLKNL